MSPTKASYIAYLEQQIQEAEERGARERERGDEAQRSLDEARRRMEDVERKLMELVKKTRKTTFEEYISQCHTHLSRPFHIPRTILLSTQCSFTSSKDKYYPTFLKPWSEFDIRQRELFQQVYDFIPKDASLFKSIAVLESMGSRFCNRPLASDGDLMDFQYQAVETAITDIITQLRSIEAARLEFNLGEDIIFESHDNNLSDSNDEVRIGLQKLSNLRKGRPPGSYVRPQYACQSCVFKKADGTETLCMIVEYKAPHKLTPYHLRAGLLRADRGAMYIPDVINRTEIPNDNEGRFTHVSELHVTIALTQTYQAMVESGLEYSWLTTGVANVFCMIKEEESNTLYYHLGEPNFEAKPEGQEDILLCRTAVSQALTLCLLACNSEPQTRKWRRNALRNSSKTGQDPEEILMKILMEKEAPTPPSSVLEARIRPVLRSPTNLNAGEPRPTRNGFGPIREHEDAQSPSGSSDDAGEIDTPSNQNTHARLSDATPTNVEASRSTGNDDIHQRQYCTQTCLIGLVRGSPLDKACPNAIAHQVQGSHGYHALDQKALAARIRDQVEEDPDHGCEPLGKQGSRGTLFKMTLDSHGYTFVAKGTVKAFVPDLEYEGEVYQHLSEVQGDLVPVYLGNIALLSPFFLDVGVRIVHMLLMSWGGERAWTDPRCQGRDLGTEVARAETKLSRHYVDHGDIRKANVLWNSENDGVMLIDFERSRIFEECASPRGATNSEVQASIRHKSSSSDIRITP